MLNQNDAERSAVQVIIRERLADLIERNPRATAEALTTTVYSLLAKAYPGKPTLMEQQQIRKNIPEVTFAQIEEHAIRAEGVRLAIRLASRMVGQALDYHPESCSAEFAQRDDQMPDFAKQKAAAAVNRGLEAAMAEGMSPYGAVFLMILAATERAAELNVHPMQVLRPLNECMERVQQRLVPPSERTEAVVTALAMRLGISRSQARERLLKSD